MYYSLIGLLAFITLVITNHDIFFKLKTKNDSIIVAYRNFLLTVAVFYLTDMLWGILDVHKLRILLFIDTELFFIAMALGILFLTRYAVAYMQDNSLIGKILRFSGIAFSGTIVVFIIINIFHPIVFEIADDCGYHPLYGRYLTLGFQILMLLFISIYSFLMAWKTRHLAGRRYFTIGLFGLIMLVSISFQIPFPLLPLYSIGYLLGCTMLRTFIVETEKEEYRFNLEEAFFREQTQSNELKTAWNLAYTDALTGVKSKLAFIEFQTRIDQEIYDGSLKELALVVFDLNNLKHINDTKGHEYGDNLIVDGCKLIRDYFKNSSIYRIGGDEFIAILDKQDYSNRIELLSSFNNRIMKNISSGDVVISSGMAEYVPEKDQSCKQVVERADLLMYEQKDVLKRLSGKLDKE